MLGTKKIILAGGSKVSKINVLSMESSLVMTACHPEMNEVPESLVTIGGGAESRYELGRQAFMTFGSKVTVIEMMDRIEFQLWMRKYLRTFA